MKTYVSNYYECYLGTYEVEAENKEEAEKKLYEDIMEGRESPPETCCLSFFKTEVKNISNSKKQDMNSLTLTKKIIDCLSDGYDDEENREEEEIKLYNELSQLNGDNYIRTVLKKLCERIEDLEK